MSDCELKEAIALLRDAQWNALQRADHAISDNIKAYFMKLAATYGMAIKIIEEKTCRQNSSSSKAN